MFVFLFPLIYDFLNSSVDSFDSVLRTFLVLIYFYFVFCFLSLPSSSVYSIFLLLFLIYLYLVFRFLSLPSCAYSIFLLRFHLFRYKLTYFTSRSSPFPFFLPFSISEDHQKFNQQIYQFLKIIRIILII